MRTIVHFALARTVRESGGGGSGWQRKNRHDEPRGKNSQRLL